ncbi:glycosyltransferase [Ralstonia sp. UBA689]|uniref:glycosyltransferase n=1 Tax=Ralstonia sp. UBA689 TaxID=1947373 RepID=UPI0025D740AD|nr:glycosyltransferase [Ralstonia sp. UBA689]
MIPKTLHFIWVGDETKRPDNCIQTWAKLNPDYQIKIWGNATLAEHKWLNARHMDAMLDREFNGVADMMRWEILYKEGGIVLDADSICLRPLDDALLDCEAFACWESEIARPGLIAAGYFGCKPGNPFVQQIMVDIHNEPSVVHDMAWKTVGPLRLTESYRRYQYHPLRILPSHFFIPEHFSGVKYDGPGPVYANQMWASTKRNYDSLHQQQFDANGQPVEPIQATAPVPAAAQAAQTAPAPAAPSRSKLEAVHDPYFVQRVPVSTDVMSISRVDVFRRLCEGKRVLHIGCADWPITDPKTSLHLALEPVCAKLDGFDIHAEALDALKPYTRGRLFSRFEDIQDQYDIVLAPEVMEHVPDVAGFLKQLDSLNTHSYVITVPDAFQCHARHFDYLSDTQTFVEVVHPDHNCWYTPYTLSNTIKKYTPWNIDGIWFFNAISLFVLASKCP